MRIFGRRKRGSEEGQSLTELAVGLPFVMLVIIAIVEMGMIFATYISMINATREGAVYASMHPELVTASQADCSNGANTSSTWCQYQARVRNEVFVATTNPLRQAQLLNYDENDDIVVNQPTTSSGSDPGDPITVLVTVHLSTFSSNISLPFFGRFGLPNSYTLSYSMDMPIR